MNTVLKNVLLVILGIVVGSAVNMGIIIYGTQLLPLAEAMDPMNAKTWGFNNFLVPFLAHALGTFVGAYVVAKFSSNHQVLLSQFVGLFFLAGGMFMVVILPAPLWFVVIDLLLAYLTMSLLAAKLAGANFSETLFTQ